MNISFTFKNFEPSEHLKKYASRRFEKLGRFFGKASGLDVQVNLSVEKYRHRCEVNVSGEGLQLSATEQTTEMYSSIDLVLAKLGSQIKKYVSKNKKQHRHAGADVKIDVFTYKLDEIDYNSDTQIKGTERFVPKPMFVEEAVLQLGSMGGEFLVFLNAENDRINVIYNKSNGGYALIDPIVYDS